MQSVKMGADNERIIIIIFNCRTLAWAYIIPLPSQGRTFVTCNIIALSTQAEETDKNLFHIALVEKIVSIEILAVWHPAASTNKQVSC